MTVFGRDACVRYHHWYKLQPGVMPQVKSLLRNLRSTVKVATMRLQGPHTHTVACTIYRTVFLWIPPSLHPSFSSHLPTISSHVLFQLFSLWAIKWQTRSKYCNVITRTPCFLFLPLTLPPAPSPHFSSPRGGKWGQIFSFLLCDLIRAMTLVAAYRAGGNS